MKQFYNPPFSYHVETRNVFILSSLAYQHVYMVICIYIDMFTRYTSTCVTIRIPLIFRSTPVNFTFAGYHIYEAPGIHNTLIFQLNLIVACDLKIEPVPVKGTSCLRPRLQFCTVLYQIKINTEIFFRNHPVEEYKKRPPRTRLVHHGTNVVFFMIKRPGFVVFERNSNRPPVPAQALYIKVRERIILIRIKSLRIRKLHANETWPRKYTKGYVFLAMSYVSNSAVCSPSQAFVTSCHLLGDDHSRFLAGCPHAKVVEVCRRIILLPEWFRLLCKGGECREALARFDVS